MGPAASSATQEVFPTPSSPTQAVEAEVHKAGWWVRGLGEVAPAAPGEILSEGQQRD